jgi:SAM-dependent methyltransferase
VSIKQTIPWQAKIAGKIVLSRLPSDYRFWQRVNLFKHGDMERPEYAYKVFTTHFERVDFPKKNGGFTALEIGPGDTLFSAIIARTYGAARCYLVDVGQFACEDLAPYQAMAEELNRRGLSAPDVNGAGAVETVLSACKAQYLVEGLRSLRKLPIHSVDFIWSQAVLEHIRLADFPEMVKEMRRVLHPDGACSHRVDLMDHLGGALNNLRFSTRFWESDFMARSGFYTNRIRYSEMLEHFKMGGFDVEVVQIDRWRSLPTPRNKLAPEFRKLPDDDLLISGFDVILRPR